MRAFRYSLQALLSLREGRERKALEVYGDALAEREASLARLEEFRRAEQETWSGWKEQITKGCTAGAMIQWQACCRKMDELRAGAEAALDRSSRAAEDSLQEMLHARRDREAVAGHRDRQRAAFDKETGRSQQDELDDLGQRCRVEGAAPSQARPT